MSDLKGKRFGVSRFGATSDSATRYALRHFGLNPDTDAIILQIGDQPEAFAALTRGGLDGAIFVSPNDIRILKLGYKLFLDLSTLDIPFPHTSIVSTRRLVSLHPEPVRRFHIAYAEGIKRLVTDKPFAMRVVRDYIKSNDTDVLEGTYQFAVQHIERIPYITEKSVRSALEEISEKNPKAKAAKPSDFIDLKIVQELDGNGFYKNLWELR